MLLVETTTGSSFTFHLLTRHHLAQILVHLDRISYTPSLREPWMQSQLLTFVRIGSDRPGAEHNAAGSKELQTGPSISRCWCPFKAVVDDCAEVNRSAKLAGKFTDRWIQTAILANKIAILQLLVMQGSL